MPLSRNVKVMVLAAVVLTGLLFCDLAFFNVEAQTRPLTYPELITALQSKLPNQVFSTRSEMITWVITQIRSRKVDKPLTKDREDDLRQAGATEELIDAIRANSPAIVMTTPTPEKGPVDLGDLMARVVNLVKPEYTPEALQARTTGEVKLALELDENGRVAAVSRLTVLENGLTERAIEAARRSTFKPATRNGKPARGTGILRYNFKINLIDVAATLAAADELKNKFDCDRAIPEYTRILGVDAKHAKALLGRGTCYLMNAEYAPALADLTAAAKSDNRDADIFFFTAVVFDLKGDPSTAAENYAKAAKLRPELEKQPTFDCLYIDRRPMSPDQGKSAANGIINACNQAFRGASGQLSGLLYYKRGIAYRMRTDYDKAIADFENVKRTNPQFAAVNGQLQIAFNSRGLEAFNKKDYKKAFDDVSLAIGAEPQSPTPYINRCAIYLYAWKQYAEAISDCSAAIRLTAKSSTAYSHRGYAYEMSNSRNEAIADYKKALEIDPQNQAARTNLNRLEPQRPTIKND